MNREGEFGKVVAGNDCRYEKHALRSGLIKVLSPFEPADATKET